MACALAGRGLPVRAEGAAWAAVPSGPNSVLGPRTPRGRRSVPDQVLAQLARVYYPA